jgi:hypothetical protein
VSVSKLVADAWQTGPGGFEPPPPGDAPATFFRLRQVEESPLDPR